MVGVAIEHPPLVTSGTSSHLVVISGIVIVVWSLIAAIAGIMAEIDAMCAAVEFVLLAHHGALAITLGPTSSPCGVSFSSTSSTRLRVT